MNLTIQTTFMQANDHYFEALRHLSQIVETPDFIEYVHKDKQIYIRHDKRIGKGDGCCVFIEPQCNLTRTLRLNRPAFKLQLTIYKHDMKYDTGLVGVNIIANPMTSDDFIEGLNVCQDWKKKLREFVAGCELPEEVKA